MKFFAKRKLNSLQKKALELYKARQQGEPSPEAIAKEITIHYRLGRLYDKLRFKKAFPNAEIFAFESYRNAAALEDANARYVVGQRLMDRGKFWDKMRKSAFGCKTHEKYAKDAYEEAFVYLKAAEEQGHPLAKRLHGLAYINAWGISQDIEKGFNLVVSSIDQENAWARATKIFEELGLNKPEFFSYVMRSRGEKK